MTKNGPKENSLIEIQSELQKGMSLEKCRKCECMKETLEYLRSSLLLLKDKDSAELLKHVESWLEQTGPTTHGCLGCKHCFPATVMNVFNQLESSIIQTHSSRCDDHEVEGQTWPPLYGEYFALCDRGSNCSVAVSTLASPELAGALAKNRPRELCIVGKTETENIGIEKVIKNIITNPTIRVLLLAGKDPEGHHSGATLLTLSENGVDENMRVIDSPGQRPFLRNVTREEVEAFRKQVHVVDMMGCEDVTRVVEKIKELSKDLSTSCSCRECAETNKEPAKISTVPVIQAKETAKVEMDRAGYFVVIPQPDKRLITTEHYSYDNKLLRVIEGKDARTLYRTVIENGWITQLSHAAYLGKELAKAELSIKLGLQYIQDSA